MNPLPTTNTSIISFSANDIPTLVKFQTSMAKETERRDLDNTTVTNFFNSIINENSFGKYFVAKSAVNNEIMGCNMVTHGFDVLNGSLSVWVQSVYVDRPYRGKGVFRALFDNVKEYSKLINGNNIYLYVDKHNIKAQEVYEKMGMVESSLYFVEKDFVFDYKIKELSRPKRFSFTLFCVHKTKNTFLDLESFYNKIKMNDLEFIGLKTKDDCFNWMKESLMIEIWLDHSLVGVMLGFVELSDWTDGLNTCINDFIFMLSDIDLKNMIDEFENYITTTNDIGFKTTSLRFMLDKGKENKKTFMDIMGYDYQQFIVYQLNQ